jgi:hypothetical protein
MASFTLKTPLIEFEFNLGEFVGILKDLVTVKMNSEAKQSLKALIMEARKSFDVVVDVLSPLYSLKDEAAMQSTFPSLYSSFKNTYLKNADEIRTHCHIVAQEIDKLIRNDSWKAHLPFVGKSLEWLRASKDKWVGNDVALSDSMSRFMQNVNDSLTEVSNRIPRDSRDAFLELKSLLSESEPELLKIKNQLNELRVVSSQL